MPQAENIEATFMVVIVYLLCITLVQNLEYDELNLLGMACFPKDSCERSDANHSFENRSCECDNACIYFNDCCVNAPGMLRRNSDRSVRIAKNIECLAYESDVGVYVISKCPPDYQGPEEIKSKCEHIEDISDPLSGAPATDIVYHLTYKNHYCAQCNDARPRNLQSWNIGISCHSLPIENSTAVVNSTYVEEHLAFLNDSIAQNIGWGFYYPDDSQHKLREFYPCDLPYSLPDSLTRHVRFCRADLVSTCAPTWGRQVVREKCEAYMAVVYSFGNVYKNPHCFVCNFGSVRTESENVLCDIPGLSITQREKKAALSFGLLMDVNISDGKKVGRKRDNRCRRNRKWDPFRKKCRTLVCLPGYLIRGGQCTKN